MYLIAAHCSPSGKKTAWYPTYVYVNQVMQEQEHIQAVNLKQLADYAHCRKKQNE